jgi:hypothetical protein
MLRGGLGLLRWHWLLCGYVNLAVDAAQGFDTSIQLDVSLHANFFSSAAHPPIFLISLLIV